MHEWEQIDQGEAYCIHCPATTENYGECVSADAKTIIKTGEPRIVSTGHKPVERVTLPREVKTEIENLRRLVQTVQDRLHALTRV